jgi:TonB family protein
MTDYISYADRKTNIKHGKVIAWYDNGNKYFEGNYKNNKKIGRWAYYAPESEKLVREGVYKDNLLDGTWISYDSTGRESFLEVYKEGVLLADSVLSTGNTPEGTSFFNPSSRPYLTKCENDSLAVQVACTRKTLLSKLLGEMKYPEKDRKLGVEGYALMSFIIDESGKVEQVKMLKSISESIEKECLKTVSNMPDWKPAKLNGKAVKVLYFLPFEFKLN